MPDSIDLAYEVSRSVISARNPPILARIFYNPDFKSMWRLWIYWEMCNRAGELVGISISTSWEHSICLVWREADYRVASMLSTASREGKVDGKHWSPIMQ